MRVSQSTDGGRNSAGNPVGSVDFYLADYRFADNSRDYIVDTWTQVDLSTLSDATVLTFAMESTDVGQFGMNTPSYFAVDGIHLVPEPATLMLTVMGAVAAMRCRGRRFVR